MGCNSAPSRMSLFTHAGVPRGNLGMAPLCGAHVAVVKQDVHPIPVADWAAERGQMRLFNDGIIKRILTTSCSRHSCAPKSRRTRSPPRHSGSPRSFCWQPSYDGALCPGEASTPGPKTGGQQTRIRQTGASPWVADGVPRVPVFDPGPCQISAVIPTASTPVWAAIASLSDVSPVTPTAPTMVPFLSRTNTPPGTGITWPP